MRRLILIAVALTIMVAGAVLITRGEDESGDLASNPVLQRRAAMITSTLENSDTTLQYAYVEDIGDGRGFTAGRAGFTTGTGDLLLLVQRWAQQRPDSPLVALLPALEEVKGTGSTAGLEGLPALWHEAAEDKAFRALQDDLVAELYLNPALDLATRYRIQTPLGQAILWDTAIQHGVQGADGLVTILSQAAATHGLPEADDEVAWLRGFLDVRLAHLLGWTEGGFTQPESSGARVDTWRGLLDQGALRLAVPLEWTAYGQTCSIDSRGVGAGPCR